MEKLILVTNDDGVKAKGLQALIESVSSLGEIIVAAPEEPQSGMSHAITVKTPLRYRIIKKSENLTIYTVNGTPVDCVKLALNKLVPRRPDMLVSGINHGSNSSTSIFYSGTLGAAIEGSVNMIPSIGFSLLNHDPEANMDASINIAKKIAEKVLENSLPKDICLNVNIPNLALKEIKGTKICRQTSGYWKEEFEERTDPNGRKYFWLTGNFHNNEPDATDTDEWALKNNYVSIVPTRPDLTCFDTMNIINKWDLT